MLPHPTRNLTPQGNVNMALPTKQPFSQAMQGPLLYPPAQVRVSNPNPVTKIIPSPQQQLHPEGLTQNRQMMMLNGQQQNNVHRQRTVSQFENQDPNKERQLKPFSQNPGGTPVGQVQYELAGANQHSAIPISHSSIPLKSVQNIEQRHFSSVNDTFSNKPTDSIRQYVTQQLEEFKIDLMKNFQTIISASIQNNEITSTQIENLKRQVGSNRKDIDEVHERMGVMNGSIEEMKNLGNLNGNLIENEVARVIREDLAEKISSLEKGLIELSNGVQEQRLSIDNKIGESLEVVRNELLQKQESKEQTMAGQVSEFQQKWEDQIREIWKDIDTKINEAKEEFEVVKSTKDETQEQTLNMIQNFEEDLMRIKAQLDSKLDANQLTDAIKGYQSHQGKEVFNQFSDNVNNLRNRFDALAKYVNSQYENVQQYQKELEVAVEQKLQTFNSNVQSHFDEDLSVSEQQKSLLQVENRLKRIESRLSELNQQLRSQDLSFLNLKTESDAKFDKLAQELDLLPSRISQNDQASKAYEMMEEKVKQLNSDVHVLINQVSQFSDKLAFDVAKLNTANNNNNNNDNINNENQQNKELNQQRAVESVNHRAIAQSNYSTVESNNGINLAAADQYETYVKKYQDFNKDVQSYLSLRNSNHEGAFREEQQEQQFEARTKSEVRIHPNIQIQGAEEEVVYELDEHGYLIDAQGNYILDDDGQIIQLTSEHIEYLKNHSMLEDPQDVELVQP